MPPSSWYSWTGAVEDANRGRTRGRGFPVESLVRPPAALARFLRDDARTSCTCVLMRLEAIARTGGFENAFRGMFEDQAFFYNLFATSGVWIDSAYLERYRQRPDSWCHRMRDLGEWNGSDLPSTSRRQFLEWLGAYVETASITDADLEREWRRPMRPFTHPLVYRVSRLARRLAGPRARACED